MDFSARHRGPERPARSAFWNSTRGAVDDPADDGASRPSPVATGTLDSVHAVFWQWYRHLFPAHSLAAQAANGSLVISWSVVDDPHARYPYATPVMLRFDEQLLDAMWKAAPRERAAIAQKHEGTLREGLRGYDPFARFPHARVVVIG